MWTPAGHFSRSPHFFCASSRAPRLHQLFHPHAAAVLHQTNCEHFFTPRQPQVVHVDSPLAVSGRRDEDEVLVCFDLNLSSFLQLSAAMKLWLVDCFYLCRCCSWLERLLCCVLVLVSRAASQWPGKSSRWKHEQCLWWHAYTSSCFYSNFCNSHNVLSRLSSVYQLTSVPVGGQIVKLSLQLKFKILKYWLTLRKILSGKLLEVILPV